MANRRGKSGSSDKFFFSPWVLKSLQMVTTTMKFSSTLPPWKKSYDKQHIKKQTHHFANKSLYSQRYDFSSSHGWMWELDDKEGWVPKNWFWIVLEKTLESSLECKEIKPVNPKGNQPWLFIVSTDAETETPVLWPSDVKNWLIGKDPDAGKGGGLEEKGATEDEMVR